MAADPLGTGVGAIPRADAVRTQPDIQLHARRAGQRRPRGRQPGKGVGRVAVFRVLLPPVELRRQVVHRSLPQPPRGVAVLQGVALLRVARRGRAEPHAVPPGHAVAKLHQSVDVLPPPVVQRERRAAGGIVCRVEVRGGGGIKIVVEVDAVDGIVRTQFLDPVGNVLPHLGAGGVKVRAVCGVLYPAGVLPCGAVVAERRDKPRLQAVGVDPRLQLQPARVGGLDEDRQRVKAGVDALRAGTKVAEREICAGVERVAEGAYLRQHDGAAQRADVVADFSCIGGEGIRRGKVRLLPFKVADPHRAVGRSRRRLPRRRRCGRRRSIRRGGRMTRQRQQRRGEKDGYYK